MVTLRAQRAFTGTGEQRDVEVVVDAGVITEVGPASGDCDVAVLAPGFVDLQVNGMDTVDVAAADGADWDTIDRLLLQSGVTSWCPTIVTAPLPAYERPLARVAIAMARPPAKRPHIAGVHLEGPFLGGAPGAHPPDLLLDPDPEFLEGLPGTVRIVTLAPERPGALDAVARLAQRGVVVSLGHSTATRDQARAAREAGARLVTHLFNGMGPLHHREPGLLGHALVDDDLAASVIADLVHVDADCVALAFRSKPAGRLVLVTDAVAWRAARVGRIRLGLIDGAPRLPDGTLAGSALTMDAAIRNVVSAAGVSLARAIDAAASAPAALIGLDDRGVIAPGRRADLVELTEDLRVVRTWVGGEIAFEA